MAGGSGQRTSRVLLEVDLDAEPIEGLLTTDGRLPSRFVGWVALVSTLDALRAAIPPDHDQPGTTT